MPGVRSQFKFQFRLLPARIMQDILGLAHSHRLRGIWSLHVSKACLTGPKFGWKTLEDISMWPDSSIIERVMQGTENFNWEDKDQKRYDDGTAMNRNQTGRYVRSATNRQWTTIRGRYNSEDEAQGNSSGWLHYLKDLVLWRIVDRETVDLTRMFTELLEMGVVSTERCDG